MHSDYYLKRFLCKRGLDLEFLKQVDGPRTLKLLFRAKSFDDRTKAIKSVEQGLFGQMRVKKEEENDFSLLVAKESWTAFGMADFLRFNDPKKAFSLDLMRKISQFS